MSQDRVYALIGDSNVRRHIGRTSRRASPLLKTTQFIPCCSYAIFPSSLESIKPESTACILSCMSNFVTECQDASSSVTKRVEARIQAVYDALLDVCAAAPSRSFLVSPPMYRSSPLWYRDGLPEILTVFSQIFSEDRPKNLHLLPSFSLLEFESDGVHLTAYSGLEHLLHLIDSSEDLLTSLSLAPSSRSIKDRECSRVLEDRVTVLEQDHRRLNRVVDAKIAVDAEEADFLSNERMEDYIVVSGMNPIPSDLNGKEWQTRAVREVKELLQGLMGRQMEVVVVHNATPRSRDAEVTYNVRMASVSDARSIRRKFGSFFRGGSDGRPDTFRKISIANRVTPETKIRISVMKLLARKYKDSNPGSKTQVIGYESRPLLKITPPVGSSDRRVKTFNYVDAVRKLPNTFSTEEIDRILKRVNPKLMGLVRSTFIVLPDDRFKTARLTTAAQAGATSRDAEDVDADGVDEVDLEAENEVESNPDRQSSSAVIPRSRAAKRGADGAAGPAAKK